MSGAALLYILGSAVLLALLGLAMQQAALRLISPRAVWWALLAEGAAFGGVIALYYAELDAGIAEGSVRGRGGVAATVLGGFLFLSAAGALFMNLATAWLLTRN